MKILITGATGFIGRELVAALLQENHELHILTRNVANAALVLGNRCKYFYWDTKSALPDEAFVGIDVVMNLLGEGIADKKWTDEQKKILYNSRIESTRKVVEKITQLKIKPKTFISTSAIGIYGDRGEETITEESSIGGDFLAVLCRDWEQEALKMQSLGVRVCIIRVGLVLGKNGGALKKMTPIFKTGFGGPLGSGKQYMSWIHVSDLAQMYVWVAHHKETSGILNGTAPYPVSNKMFSSVLGSVLHRPAFIPAPAFAIHKVFGEMSTVLLSGQKVLPAKFQQQGFRFKYPSVEIALKESLS